MAADSDGELSCQGERWVCGGEIYDWNGVCMFGLVGLIYLRMIKLVCVCCRDTRIIVGLRRMLLPQGNLKGFL